MLHLHPLSAKFFPNRVGELLAAPEEIALVFMGISRGTGEETNKRKKPHTHKITLPLSC